MTSIPETNGDAEATEQPRVPGSKTPLEKLDWFFRRAQEATDPMTRIVMYIACKSICQENQLHSLTGDYIGLIGREKENINREISRENRQRRKDGIDLLPLLPIVTWGGANDKDPRLK